jgi:hypothetical protein
LPSTAIAIASSFDEPAAASWSWWWVLGVSLAFAIGYRSYGIWVVAAAVLVAELLRHLGYLGLMWRIVGFSAA